MSRIIQNHISLVDVRNGQAQAHLGTFGIRPIDLRKSVENLSQDGFDFMKRNECDSPDGFYIMRHGQVVFKYLKEGKTATEWVYR